ncbi:hypothetical protein [Paraferrimonas haliotis]|uniref:hypothetical protein n=1 Tax=Paraferrimonas haliotis TaxID=2013866 RepID=UPI000BA9C08D|nr:hypothetical protein [Paraferrimonas haliotis]
MRAYFTLTTLDPVILSQSTATTNNHQCLDYIPGSAILGLAASKLYPTLPATESFELFHSGKVIFGCALPFENGSLHLPMPASWHFPKGKNAVQNQQLHSKVISNQASRNFVRGTEQYKQCRTGYISAKGHIAEIKQGITTKTALENGSAKDGSLFSYAYLEANQSFLGFIEAEPAQLDTVKQTIAGTHYLGRSKASEFGRVAIEFISIDHQPQVKQSGNTLTLWLVSDAQVINAHGLATATPELADLIEGATGTLNHSSSFIRTHNASLFNQKRLGLDSELAMISKGSVLVYDEVQVTDQALQQISQTGVGLNRQLGLGQVIVNPAWSQSAQFAADAELFVGVSHQLQSKAAPAQPSSQLAHFIQRQLNQAQLQQDQQQQVQQLITDIANWYKRARKFNLIYPAHSAGPSSSQWRRVMETLRYNKTQWQQLLFDGENAICKAKNDPIGWGIKLPTGSEFSYALQTRISNAEPAMLLLACERLTRYDLSEAKELKKLCEELDIDFDFSKEGAN